MFSSFAFSLSELNHSARDTFFRGKVIFKDVLKEYGFLSSMSRRGNCWDNACSETLFGSLKV